MDLSSNEVLLLLGGIELAACVACACYWLIGRGAEARRPARRRTPAARLHPPVERPAIPATPAVGSDLEDTGRHHVPEALLQASTYRLSADRRARARVPGTGPSARPRRRRTADSPSGASR